MSFSKGEVNRAGQLIGTHVNMVAKGQRQATDAREEVEGALHVVAWWRSGHADSLSRVATDLYRRAAKEGTPIIAQRLKRVPTIIGKLLREPKMNLARMGDIGGVRAVLPDQEAVYRLASALDCDLTITRSSDYVQAPKADGYRAVHLMSRDQDRLIEVQLRTPRQDRWANGIELFSRSLVPGLKFGGGPEQLREMFRTLAELDAALDAGSPPPAEAVFRLQELLQWVDTFVDEQTDEP